MKTIIRSVIIIAFSSTAFAAKVISVKQNKVLIDLESDTFSPGDKLFALDAEGKKKALLEVRQTKGSKAIAEISKGSALKDYTLVMAKPAATGSTTPSSSAASGGSSGGKNQRAWGVSAGYSMNNMTAKPSSTTSVKLTGSSFSIKGFYQQKLDGAISVKASAGYDTFVAKGTSASASCTGSANCDVNIGYLGLDALVRYSFYEKSYRIWAGAGLGFLLAINKSSNVLDTGKISTNQTILGSFGADIPMGKDNFVPVQLDYALFPSNNTTSANQIIIRAGYGWNF